MQDIIDHFNSNGLSPGNLIVDGKVHRFNVTADDKKKCGWYCGFENHLASSGKMFHVVRYGNFKTGEVFQFKTDTPTTPQDKKLINDMMAKAKAKAEAERELEQENVSNDCLKIWETLATTGSHEYLIKKNLPNLFGARLDTTALIIPVKDVDGKIWSFQRIWPDGVKRFKSKGKVVGNFHTIGEISDGENIYICEGFATGATIHMAIQQPVIVAFDSGNLERVAAILKQKYPEKNFVICGDDDVYTKNQKGEPWNPGREAATSAATACLGTAVFPRFQSPKPGASDFNDLQNNEGIERVREQITGIKIQKTYVKCLGYNGGSYFYTSSSNKQIVELTAHSETDMASLQPLSYWHAVFPSETGVNWKAAKFALMDQCRSRGVFNPGNIRGVGVWTDQDRTVVHLGDRILVDGVERDIHDLDSKYIYNLEQKEKGISKKPLSVEECQILTDALMYFNFKRKEQMFYVGGWIVTAQICGILNWRPHLMVTGEKGSGKTTIFTHLITPLLGSRHFPFAIGTTEAGIRQTVGHGAKAIVYDQFDIEDNKSIFLLQSVLQLMRQASSDNGMIAKGGATGTAISYSARFCAGIAGIRSAIENDADRSRFTMVEVLQSTDRNAWKKEIEPYLENNIRFNPEFSDRLFARIVKMIPTYKKNVDMLERALAARHSQRFAQQYAPLMAGWELLISDKVLTEDEAALTAECVNLDEELSTSGDSDQDSALDILFSKKIKHNNQDYSIGQMIQDIMSGPAAHEVIDRTFELNKTLNMHGLSMNKATGELFIASKHSELSKLMAGTKFSVNWNQTFKRLKDCTASGAVLRLGTPRNIKGIRLKIQLTES